MIHKCDVHEILQVVNSILQVKLPLTTSDAYISIKLENHLVVNGTKVVACSLVNVKVAVTQPVNRYMEIGEVAPYPISD